MEEGTEKLCLSFVEKTKEIYFQTSLEVFFKSFRNLSEQEKNIFECAFSAGAASAALIFIETKGELQ